MAEDRKINEKLTGQRFTATFARVPDSLLPEDANTRLQVETLTDDPEQNAAALEAFLSQQMKFDPTRREDKTLYDTVYINGTHNLPNLGKYGEVRLLEEEFHRRMWAGEEN